MGTHKICFYKEVDKGHNVKTTELLDCVLIGVCAVIRWNMVYDVLIDMLTISGSVMIMSLSPEGKSCDKPLSNIFKGKKKNNFKCLAGAKCGYCRRILISCY